MDTGEILNPSFTPEGRQTPVRLLLIRGDRVCVEAAADGDPNTCLSELQAIGLQNGKVHGRMVSGFFPITAIGDLENLNGIRFVRPVMAMTHVGSVENQADKAMRSDLARASFGVDGSGVTIGVLSDSYDDLGGAAGDVVSGDLPAGVVVLDPGPGGGTDEGRAMMQLIHDIAPGASQIFRTAVAGQADFAAGIIELANAGADIIVDDIGYFTEAMFQDDNVAQAVDAVEAMGIPYFSAAGNEARDSYESAFAPGTAFAPGAFPADPFFNPFIGPFSFLGGIAHDFDPGAGVDVFQSITVPEGTGFVMSFQWDEPFFSISGGAGATNEVDVYVISPTGTLASPGVPTVVGGDAGANFSGNAVEVFVFANPPGSGITTFDIMIVHDNINFGGLPPGFMKYIRFDMGDGITLNEFDTKSSTVYGHPNAAGAEAVGAAFYFNTPEFGTSPPIIEPFSSAGGTPILFDILGSPVAPITRLKPGIVAPDCTNTTFFIIDIVDPGDGSDTDVFPNFPGTSAAAPHAAAVAALMKQANPTLSPSQTFDVLRSTALDMDDPSTGGFDAGFDFGTGFGLIQADAALTKLFGVPHGFVFLAEEFVQSKQHKRFEGNILSNNDIILKKGKKSKIIGDLRAVDDIEISKKNDVDGDVTAGDKVENDGDVSGTITEDGGVAAVPLPVIASFVTGTEEIEVGKKETLELDPGAYDNVEVKKKGTLILKHDGATGDYFLETLELAKSADLVIDVSTGPVTVNVARRLVFGQKVEVEIVAVGGDGTELVTFNMPDDDDNKGDDFVEIGKKATVLGNIIAPDAWVVLKKSSRFKGAICAENIVVEKGVVALHHGSASSLPKIAPDAEDVADEEQVLMTSVPTDFELHQNHPNPFNPSTTISFAVPKAGEVSLKVYNLRGQLVATLHDEAIAAGRHQIVWDGKDRGGVLVASGIYVYRLEADGFVATKKLTLMK
jgi:cytoskeletal protein CcmA (bactofilin family)